MKKQFFYAALAIALMSSCSKDNDPGNIDQGGQNGQEVIDDTTPATIQLGVAAPQMVVSASTRGTGSAGGDNGTTWDSQELKIMMVDKGKLTQAEDGGEYIFNDLEFHAPAANASDKLITNKTGAVKYFPMLGSFDFYGFLFDDAKILDDSNTETTFAYPTTDETTTEVTYKIEIDGTQDIMIAKAALTDAQKNGATSENGQLAEADYAKAFSSWTARRGVQPSMTFEHVLTRLDFIAIAGEDAPTPTITIPAAQQANYATEWPEADGYPQPSGNQLSGSVHIKAIRVVNPKETAIICVASTDDANSPRGIVSSSTAGTTEAKTFFNLMQAPATGVDKNLVPLQAVALSATALNDDGKKVGNGIMLVPGDAAINLEIDVMQYVQKFDGTGSETEEYYWKEQTIPTTVKAPIVDGSFKAGHYYTVKATIYNFQKIEISAELTAWTAGDNIEITPEDDYWNNN